MLRFFSTKSPVIKWTIQSRNVSSAHLKKCFDLPDSYQALHTSYGWFVVPETHISGQWTAKQVEQELAKTKKVPAEPLDPKSPLFTELQRVVDKWVDSTKVAEIPQEKKLSKKEIEEEKKHMLYLKQSQGNSQLDKRKGKTGRSAKSSGLPTLNFLKTWSYFYSIKYPELKSLGLATARKHLSEQWRALNLHEKDAYRQEYAKLIELGKDVWRGDIIDIETKRKYSEKLRELKKRASDRLKAKKEKQKQTIEQYLKDSTDSANS